MRWLLGAATSQRDPRLMVPEWETCALCCCCCCCHRRLHAPTTLDDSAGAAGGSRVACADAAVEGGKKTPGQQGVVHGPQHVSAWPGVQGAHHTDSAGLPPTVLSQAVMLQICDSACATAAVCCWACVQHHRRGLSMLIELTAALPHTGVSAQRYPHTSYH